MLLKKIMTNPVEVVACDSTITMAAEMMRVHGVGVLPVCRGRELIGMVTDRYIAVRAIAAGCDPNTTTISECMSRHLWVCSEDQDSADAEELMQQKQVRRLPIINQQKELVGIVTLADLVIRTVETDEVERTMWKICQPIHDAETDAPSEVATSDPR